MELRQKVLHYYLDNFELLKPIEQFHFATRICAWLGLPQMHDKFSSLRPLIVPNSTDRQSLAELFRERTQAPPNDKINAYSLRTPYFEAYPQLRGVELAIFRLHWLQNVYNIDAAPALLDVVSTKTLQDLEQALLADPQAMRVLSTYAVNFIYLLHVDVLKDDNIPRQTFYDIADKYDTNDPQQLQLLIYLFTHCILCDAHFYTRKIPTEHLDLYRKMLTRLEKEIEAHYGDIHLDNKVEFLVCSRICGYTTELQARIDAECEQSISEEGDFIIDRHNNNPQIARRSFNSSEHRNVLYIMSGSAYNPHSIAA